MTKSKCLLAAVFNAFLALRLVRFAAVNALPPICGRFMDSRLDLMEMTCQR